MQVNADPNPENDITLNNLPTAVQTQFGLPSGGLLAAALGFAKGSASLVSVNGGSFGADGAATSDSLVYALTVTDATFSPAH